MTGAHASLEEDPRKARAETTPGEGWHSALLGEWPDRTPCHYWGNPEITAKLLVAQDGTSGRGLWQRLGIDNQQILRSGTPQEVGLEVALTLRIFRACKEYVVAPCHSIQANTLVENMLAEYPAFEEFG